MLIGVDEVVDLNVLLSFRNGDVTSTDARRIASAGMTGFRRLETKDVERTATSKTTSRRVVVVVDVEFDWTTVDEVVVVDTILS